MVAVLAFKEFQPELRGHHVLVRLENMTTRWRLHHRTVKAKWRSFGQADVDLFGTKENSHCLIYFSKEMDALAKQSLPFMPSLL